MVTTLLGITISETLVYDGLRFTAYNMIGKVRYR